MGILDDTGRLVRLGGGPHDIVFVVVEGLSASAVEKHAPSVLTVCLSQLSSFDVGPVILVEQARVGFGDEVGEALSAQIVVVLIGERPAPVYAQQPRGPSSLRAYVAYGPKAGLFDSARNCISNIHHDGLSPRQAARKICLIVCEAMRLKLTGVGLKENRAGSEIALSNVAAPDLLGYSRFPIGAVEV